MIKGQKIRVCIIESERGWGSKVEREVYFDTVQEARAFCDEYNKENNLTVVPGYYWYAAIQ